MTKSKTYLTNLIIFYILAGGASLYSGASNMYVFETKLYILSSIILVSVFITYFIGTFYQKTKKTELDLLKKHAESSTKKTKMSKAWNNLMQEAKNKR